VSARAQGAIAAAATLAWIAGVLVAIANGWLDWPVP
jgi:hypothetical protein